MGGKSSSKSSSNTTTNTTVVDRRQVVDAGAIGVSSDNSTINIQSVDAGIVTSALDTVKINDATLRDGYGKLIDATAAINTSSSNGFGQLLTLAGKLFDSGAEMIGKSQDATLAQIETINARAADQEGTIDQKTIIVLAVAGAAALVLSRGE